MKLICGVAGCILGVILTVLIEQVLMLFCGVDSDLGAGWLMILVGPMSVVGAAVGIIVAVWRERLRRPINFEDNTTALDDVWPPPPSSTGH
ncbi:MAG: hypothetical protein ABIY70_06970 [Capsulimonas sp.]|uniref:hypothetical protein n=1 Tax=Capsulimonas sp. TaxID=2494211 RepID=UPI003263AB11